MGSTVIVGGESGTGRTLAQHYTNRGATVVITGSDPGRVARTAGELERAARLHARTGGTAFDSITGVLVDPGLPQSLTPALSTVGPVQRLVLISDDHHDSDTATRRIISYLALATVLTGRLVPDAAVLVAAGLRGGDQNHDALRGIIAVRKLLSLELTPVRVNSVRFRFADEAPPGGPGLLPATNSSRATSTDEVVKACLFLLENDATNALDLRIGDAWRDIQTDSSNRR